MNESWENWVCLLPLISVRLDPVLPLSARSSPEQSLALQWESLGQTEVIDSFRGWLACHEAKKDLGGRPLLKIHGLKSRADKMSVKMNL